MQYINHKILTTKKNLNLTCLNYKSLSKLLTFIKGKHFHATQLFKWIYQKNLNKIDLMSNINNKLKITLKFLCNINHLIISKEKIDDKNTIKLQLQINSKNSIETVIIPNKKTNFTICLSSQIGCNLNCSFCYTAKHGFNRNLKTDEIIGQLLVAKIKLYNISPHNKITNIVMMGMGEPLLNIKNLLNTIDIIQNKYAFNISKNKITVSTSGIIPEIETLSTYHIPLAISLHAATNKLRTKLMPINKKYNLNTLIKTCKSYSKKNKLTIEYILLNNINDSKYDALKLTKLLKNIKCKICLLTFNHFPGTIYTPTPDDKIITFQKILKHYGFITTIRQKMGKNINAACGQLAGNFLDITKRHENFKNFYLNSHSVK